MKLSQRAKKLQPSATLAITAKEKALKAQGVDVIGFGAGEPDFDSPENVKEEAIRAIRAGFTKYTAVGGIDELKEAIINRMKLDYGLEYQKPEIIVSNGAKHTLYNLTQAMFEEGDEVIVPAPYWVSYPEQITLAGADPVILNTREEEGFKIDPAELKKLITPKTRALVLNYPSNPTGATYNEVELRRIVDVAMEAGLTIISDEIYDKIIFDGIKHTPVATLGEDVKKATILVNGVSKTYAMTGWRIGYAAGDKDVINAMGKLHIPMGRARGLQGSSRRDRGQDAGVRKEEELYSREAQCDTRHEMLQPAGGFLRVPQRVRFLRQALQREGYKQLHDLHRVPAGRSQGGRRSGGFLRLGRPCENFFCDFDGKHREGDGQDRGSGRQIELSGVSGFSLYTPYP